MNESDAFYTPSGYRNQQPAAITAAMEDYLEMIARLSIESPIVRISMLAGHLHVLPSSATKMAAVLRDAGLIDYERYGTIRLTESGAARGAELLERHDALIRFFQLLNAQDPEPADSEREILYQVEQIEHFLTPATVRRLERLTRKWETASDRT